MTTRTQLREHERIDHERTARPAGSESPHGLLDWAEEWAEETSIAPEDGRAEGVPWHLAVLVVVGLMLVVALEIALTFGIAKLVTGHAY
jgi:hypothetical protein